MLTPRRAAVAELLQSGLSIGKLLQARGTSIRTVANWVVSLMRKLGVGSRVELARALS